MKKAIMMSAMVLAAMVANAQKTTTYRYEDTQARAMDIVSTGYVKPLTVELKVDAAKGRQRFSYDMDKDFVETDMKGDVENIRSYGLFKASADANCDVIVAPTFHLFTNNKGGYTLEVVGYAGNFVNWKTMTTEDMSWIDKAKTTGDRQNIDAKLKPGK